MIGELESLVDQYPLREGLWSSLITALYRAGRQADALATYARVRDLLVDELGVDPGPRLRSLEEQILRQSESLGGDRSRTAAATGGTSLRCRPRSSAGPTTSPPSASWCETTAS